MNLPNLNLKTFYLLAWIAMLIVVLANIWNLTNIYSNLTLPGKVSYIAGSICFQGLLFILFLGLWKNMPGKIIDDSKLSDLMDEIKGER